MEKDLRDAYKALKLMRADLTRTRKEKQALEEQLVRRRERDDDSDNDDNNDGNNNNGSADNEDTSASYAQLEQLQSAHAALQHENAALRQQNAELQQRLAQCAHCVGRVEDRSESEFSAAASSERATKTPTDAQATDAAAATVSNQDHESERTAETEPVESPKSDDGSVQSQSQPTAPLKKQPEDELEDASSSVVEEMVREKLGLLANLYTLKNKLEEQASEMLTQQAAFAHERDELCMQLEELSEQMIALQDHVMDVEHEKQFLAEKYDFLTTQLDLVQQQQQSQRRSSDGSLGHEQQHSEPLDDSAANSRDGIELKLRELESIREQLESERRLLQQQQQQSPAVSDAKSSGAMTAESETARRLTSLLHANAVLQQQVAEKDTQLVALQQQQQQQQQQQAAADADSQLQSQAADSATSRERLEAQVLALTTQTRELTGANETLDQALDAMRRERDDAVTQCKALHQQLRDAESKLAALQHSLEAHATARDAAAQEHVRELQPLRIRVDELAHRERELLERLDAADTEAHAQRTALEQRVEACRMTHQQETEALRDRIAVLDAELTVRSAAVSKLQHELECTEQQRVAREQQLQTQFADTLSAQRAQQDKVVKGSAMEAKALQHEARQLHQALKHKHDALEAALAASRDAAATRVVLEARLRTIETQRMALEDTRCSAEDTAFDDVAGGVMDVSATWRFIARHVRTLDTFLPQLQHFAGVVDAALCLCESNAAALDVLSVQHGSGSDSNSLAYDVVSFLRCVTQLRRVVESTVHAKQARRLHRRVREALTHWCECIESGDVPAPPFGIASREAALVLINWTSDKSKRASAKRWLERMESVSATANSLDDSDDGSERSDALLLSSAAPAAEGSTLELQAVTLEVKQAFLMLIVPILRRNAAIFVRVFTRLAPVGTQLAASNSATGVSDVMWEMKIHVQLRKRWRASASSLAVPLSSPRRGSGRPPPLDLSTAFATSSAESLLANNERARSTRELTDIPLASPPTSSSSQQQKLQIIQQRLQRMQSHRA